MRPGARARAADPGDLDTLVELCLTARDEAAVGSQLCSDDATRLRQQLGALLGAGGVVLVGTVDDQPAGFVLARVVGPSLFTDASVLVLEAIYVVPGARRRGLGHVLLTAAAQAADEHGAGELFAQPLPGARGMQRFLARLGFAPAAAHRSVTTAALQRRLAHDHTASSMSSSRRPPSRGLEDLIARRRQAREARRAPDADQVASTSMQVNRAVQTRFPSASSTTIS